MSIPLPTVEQVRALPRAHHQAIPPEFADANGHMNIVRYMQLHNDAAWTYMHHFGLGEEHATEGSAGSFEVEQHLRYLREVYVGDVVGVHIRMLGRSEKALHVMQFLVNVTRDELANTFESMSLSIDMATRKVVAYPLHVVDLIDAQLRIDQALSWAAPLAGAMGPR